MDRKNSKGTDQREQLIADHLHFPRVIAREVMSGLDRRACLDDLIASGNMGLVEAAARFDPACGVTFTTFAWPRIRGAMVDGVRRSGPFGRAEVKRFRKEAANNNGRPLAVNGKRDNVADHLPEHVELELELEVDVRRYLPRLAHLLKRLPDREREIARLHYFEGMPLTDIAARLGLSRSWVTRLHQWTLQQLQDAIALPPSDDSREAV
jgi:RNA polymerase sigma factor FliA